MITLSIPLYNGKHSWEKTFTNFEVLWLVFSVKFGGVMPFAAQVFSAEILFSIN